MALDPDQEPEAVQLEALDELQVKVTLVFIATELALDDKETLAAGVGGGPESDPPPPPPQEMVKIDKKSKTSTRIVIQRFWENFYNFKIPLNT